MTKRIELTQGKFALVDDEDFERVNARKWNVLVFPTRMYASGYARHTNEVHKKGVYKKELMHRFILDAPPGVQVDHIDGDGLNCTKANLRFVGHAQNQWNRGKHRDNHSGYKGVDWSKQRQRWRARIMVHRKNIHLGLFDTPEDAARAYNEAAIQHHGQYARLNIIPEETPGIDAAA